MGTFKYSKAEENRSQNSVQDSGATTGAIAPQKLSLPKGGGAIRGISESFQAHSSTGTGGFSIPIPLPSSRQLNPTLSVDYHSGAGNGVFGMGFNVSTSSVIRKTSKKVPTYDDTDTFVLTGVDDLAFVKDTSNADYSIKIYRPRVERLFARIERWSHKLNKTIHWHITNKDGSAAIYGQKPAAQVYDGAYPTRVAEWLLESSADVYGNQIDYFYRSSETGGEPAAGKVLDRIGYGCHKQGGYYHFEVVFDYGPNDFAEPTDQVYHTNNPAIKRLDAFTSYTRGFALRNELLCRAIRIYHRFEELGPTPKLVKGIYFDYDEKPIITYLRAVKEVGYHEDNKQGKRYSKTTPALILSYTQNDPSYLCTVSEPSPANPCAKSKLIRLLKAYHYGFSDVAQWVETQKGTSWTLQEAGKPTLQMKKSGNYLNIYDPSKKPSFKRFSIADGGRFPNYINQLPFEFVDLYQEGIEGILYNDGETLRYWRPNGNGQFASAEQLKQFPLLRNPSYELTSLEANGRLELYVNQPHLKGYYPFDPSGAWGAFTPLEATPTDWASTFQEMVDVTGDGRVDLLVFEGERLKVYPSQGRKGYQKAFYEKTPKDVPNQRSSSESVAVRFADLFGDGKSHLVRVENGEVACWPNLGYGRFGEKLTFENAPYFRDGLDAKRLFFADVDGSGTADLLYAENDHLKFYYNQSGHSFSDPVRLELPVPYDSLTQISIADILGNGTSCLLLSYIDENLQAQHLYYDFYNGEKPHLLKQIDGNRGATTHIHYAPSTKFYLQDREQGKPWATHLPFPVQVIEQVETLDHITGGKLSNRYGYHHGYYDHEEKEFRGFGFVETWDTEDFAAADQKDEHYVAPVYTKTWYHTGAYEALEALLKAYRADFYQDDAQALKIVPQRFDSAIAQEGKRDACRALQGQLLRQEVYGLDQQESPDLYQHPYTVTESGAQVKLLQSSTADRPPVFFTHIQETISYQYERNPKDPRMRHDFALEVDDYGQVVQSASIAYPRRSQAKESHCEQQKLHVTLEYNRYLNHTQDFYLLGLLYQTQSFEIGGLKLDTDGYICFEDLKKHIDKALLHFIPFEQELSPREAQARLLDEKRRYYWNKDQTDALPWDKDQTPGTVVESPQALLHHTETMMFSDAQIKEVFAGKKISDDQAVDDRILRELGYKNKAQSWWAPSATQYYHQRDQYYLPEKTIEIFGAETTILYDGYTLFPVKTLVKATGRSNIYETRAVYDYQRLSPVQLIDSNDNISEALLDPLGKVMVTSVYGTENGAARGDKPLSEYSLREHPNFENILGIDTQGKADASVHGPAYYLQKATAFFYYDLEAWQQQGQPVRLLVLQRDTHVWDESEGVSTKIRRSLTHLDGFGRTLTGKLLSDSSSNAQKWLTSGRVIYNNKGGIVKQYEPYYSDTPYYPSEEAIDKQGVAQTYQYDPLLRNVRIDHPKGFFTQMAFIPWSVKSFDVNDTVKDSSYYKTFMAQWDKAGEKERAALRDEKDALDKAVCHYNTPGTAHLDNLGRAFLQVEILKKKEKGPAAELISHVQLDVQDNELASVDPRFFEQNKGKPESEQLKNFRHTRCPGGLFKSISADAGAIWTLANAAGRTVYIWDGNGTGIHTEYDPLQRPTQIAIRNKELKLEHVAERFFYAEDPADKATNRYGALVAHYEPAGLTQILANDIQGRFISGSFILRKNYQQEAHWKDMKGITSNHPDLEKEVFSSSSRYNALGEVIQKTDPQNNAQSLAYDLAGRLEQIQLQKPGGTAKTYVKEIRYNAKGQRASISYGNGLRTKYSYEKDTFRLTSLRSFKGQKAFQDMAYFYDPTGNITRIRDHAYKSLFPKSKVEGLSDFHYDSLYRLAQATGKEHPNLSRAAHKNPDEYIMAPIPHLNDQMGISGYAEHYDFDAAGNLTQIQHTGESAFTRAFYIDQRSNRSLLQTNGGAPITQDDIEKHYDANGNLLQLDGVVGAHWNYRNNLSHVEIIARSSGKNDSEHYVYDGSGQRVRKLTVTYGNGEAAYTKIDKIYLGNLTLTRTYKGSVSGGDPSLLKEKCIVSVMDDRNRVAFHHYWRKGANAKEGAGQDRYQLDNHLGSVAMELSARAEIMTYEEYFPFGGTALIGGASVREVTEKEYKYSGKERDEATGLYYYGARYYAPWLARWINPDPAGTVDGLNLFGFVGGNPVTLRDINGNNIVSSLVSLFIKSPEEKFLENPYEFLIEKPISTCLPPMDNPQTGKQNFNLVKNNHGANYFLSTSDKKDEGIQAYWLLTKEKITVDLKNKNEPDFIFTPELQGCALYVKLDRDQGKMKIRHRMFSDLEVEENKEKEESESKRLKGKGYTPILEWEEYGMSKEDYKEVKAFRKSFIPVTAFFYRDPKRGWNLIYQKIRYESNDPLPNFNCIKSITKMSGSNIKYVPVNQKEPEALGGG